MLVRASACSARASPGCRSARHEELATQAENNRIAVVPVVPNRGLILDRNGVVLANNYSAYTLEIAPAQGRRPRRARSTGSPSSSRSSRATASASSRLLDENKSFESLPIRTKLTDDEVARFTAQRFRFAGVDIKARLFRSYPLGEVGSHLIGYIGRINAGREEGDGRELVRGRPRQLPRHRVHRQARRRAELRGRAARPDRLRGGRDERRRPCGAPPAQPARRRPATRSSCRSTSGCRRWSRSCSATGAARWSRSTRATARCWPSSASRTSTPTCSSTASTSRTGRRSTSRPTSRCSTGRCAAPTRPARPTSRSWRWRR